MNGVYLFLFPGSHKDNGSLRLQALIPSWDVDGDKKKNWRCIGGFSDAQLNSPVKAWDTLDTESQVTKQQYAEDCSVYVAHLMGLV